MKDTSIEGTVVRNTLRVVKEMNLFQYFICAYSHNPKNVIAWIIRNLKSYNKISSNCSSDNPFCNVKVYANTIEILKKMERNNRGERDKVIQMNVMDCTNSLLHYCLERNLAMSGHDIGKIGEQIFNASCNELLGNGFKDLTDSSPQQVDSDAYDALMSRLRDMYPNDNDFLEALRMQIGRRVDDNSFTLEEV